MTWIVLASLLFAAAIAVRGIAPRKVVLPKDAPLAERPKLRDPMQLLGAAAGLRATELDALIAPTHAAAFKELRTKLFALRDCPQFVEWANSADGQRFERLFNDLRAGSKEEAFAALALVFRLARACEWKPGLLAHTEHAEKLAAYLQDWLRAWGESGATDPLLSDAALSASLVYGRVMQTAWSAPIVGHNAAPYERALAFLNELVGAPPARRTAFGEALQARYPRAMNRLTSGDAALAGFAEECVVLFPDLDGACGR
jgi:hypothetical protein